MKPLFLCLSAICAMFFSVPSQAASKQLSTPVLGGMAHQESWDPKPYAPLEYRGPFKSIPTKIPGVRFSENFKQSAKIADKITKGAKMHP